MCVVKEDNKTIKLIYISFYISISHQHLFAACIFTCFAVIETNCCVENVPEPIRTHLQGSINNLMGFRCDCCCLFSSHFTFTANRQTELMMI